MTSGVADFAARFGREPEVRGRAPGRVNLIGEHTDYNDGFVLPVAIPQTTTAELAARGDDLVRAATADLGDGAIVEFRLGTERRSGGWIDYVQGVTAALRSSGVVLPAGFDLFISSEVPVGAGVSSSAALEVSLLRALRGRFRLALGDLELALIGRRAENELVGAPVGVMDQMAASLADESTALFIDTRSLEHERVPLPGSVELAVIDSRIAHAHASGAYRTRRAECERAAELLGVRALRDVDVAAGGLERVAALPEPLCRRARHVVTENQRVLDAVAALRAGDLGRLGALFAASQASMRDDYEVSVPEIDRLVALAAADPDVVGARMTGGGFGGAVVLLVRRGGAAAAGARVVDAYGRASGRSARLLVPRTP